MKTLDRLYRRYELPQFIGLRRTQIDELIAAGEFPKGVKISDRGRTLAWFESDIAEWQKARKAKSRGECHEG